jgi:hypothetical protein
MMPLQGEDGMGKLKRLEKADAIASEEITTTRVHPAELGKSHLPARLKEILENLENGDDFPDDLDSD